MRHRSKLAAVALLVLVAACGDPAGPGPDPEPTPRLTQVTAGGSHSCALDESGQAFCWGNNNFGAIGDSTDVQRATPTAVRQGALRFTTVAAGDSHTCALAADGQAYCWGFGGALGDGTAVLRRTPVRVLLPSGVRLTSLTASDHTCGLTAAGQAYCWGSNFDGRLGDGTTNDGRAPVAVSQGQLTFASLVAGGSHTCGLTSGGQAYCWGANGNAELGDGTNTQRTTPTAVAQSGVVFRSLAAGFNHTCGLTQDGRAYCWGWNVAGQLGDGTTVRQRSVPVAVSQGAIAFASLAGRTDSTCGRTQEGQVYCWGGNTYGEMGDGTTTMRVLPTAVQQPAGVSFTALAAGAGYRCALTAAGQPYCWGRNDAAQLGDGTTTMRLTPVPVTIPS